MAQTEKKNALDVVLKTRAVAIPVVAMAVNLFFTTVSTLPLDPEGYLKILSSNSSWREGLNTLVLAWLAQDKFKSKRRYG